MKPVNETERSNLLEVIEKRCKTSRKFQDYEKRAAFKACICIYGRTYQGPLYHMFCSPSNHPYVGTAFEESVSVRTDHPVIVGLCMHQHRNKPLSMFIL